MAERQPARSLTPRGFVIYDEFTDTRGSKIRVQQSSSAEIDGVWIFVNDELATEDRPAHLSAEQAGWVRDALGTFIGEHRA